MYMSPTENRAIAYGAGSFIPFESIDVMGDTLLQSLSISTSNQDSDALALLLRMMAVRATIARIIIAVSALEPSFQGGVHAALETLSALEYIRTDLQVWTPLPTSSNSGHVDCGNQILVDETNEDMTTRMLARLSEDSNRR